MAHGQSAGATSRKKNRPSAQKLVQNTNSKRQEARRRRRRPNPAERRKSWYLIGGIIALIVVVIGVFIFLGNRSNSTITGNINTTADATTLKQVTGVDGQLLAQIGTGGISNPFQTVQATSSILKGPTGKPEVFFYGADWCPLCAAERWPAVVALSRFGTFTTLGETASSSTDTYPNTSTFTFSTSKYSSSVIDFVPVEEQDRDQNTIQTPTAEQQQMLTKYQVTGYPFMNIGDRYLIKGVSYDPSVLRSDPQDTKSQPLTQQEIASQISSQNTLSRSILGTANYLTAAICAITNNQPSEVCNDATIQKIEATLPQTAVASAAPQHTAATGALATINATEPARRNSRWL